MIQNNIIPGRMKKFLEEVTLLNQKFVINPDLSVGQAAKEAGVEVVGYARLAVGAGILFNVPFLGQNLPISVSWGEAILEEKTDRTRNFQFDIGVGF